MRNPFEKSSSKPEPKKLSRRTMIGVITAAVGLPLERLVEDELDPPTRVGPNGRYEEHPERTRIGSRSHDPLREDASPDTFEPGEEIFDYRFPVDEEAHRRDPHMWEAAEARLHAFETQLKSFETSVRRELHVPHDSYTGIGTYAQFSTEEQNIARARMASSGLREAFVLLADDLVIHGKMELFWDTLHVFSMCSTQGIVYDTLQQSAARLYKQIPLRHEQDYFGSRVRDYLPEARDIQKRDIDPRNVRDNLARNEPDLIAHLGWAGRIRITAFKELVADVRVRRAALDADLTIVEFFSLIKAIIHERERLTSAERSRVTLEETMHQILAARENFMQTNLFDRTTQEAIILYGNAVATENNAFGGDQMHYGLDPHGYRDTGGENKSWKFTLHAAGIPDAKIKTFGTTDAPAPDVTRVKNAFLQAIATSQGKTFVATDSHGLPEQLEIDNRQPTIVIDPASLADALVKRLHNQRDARTLEQLTLCIEACYSYNFSRNVIQELQRQWNALAEKPFLFSDVGLPRIITTTQEHSFAHHDHKIFMILADQVQAIRKDRGVSGARLLQCVGPLAYAYNDITVFQEGSGREFAARKSLRDQNQHRATV